MPSCILNIDRVESNMEGVWSFSIDREVRNRNISQTVELEVVMVELPTAVYLQYEDKQVNANKMIQAACWLLLSSLMLMKALRISIKCIYRKLSPKISTNSPKHTPKLSIKLWKG